MSLSRTLESWANPKDKLHFVVPLPCNPAEMDPYRRNQFLDLEHDDDGVDHAKLANEVHYCSLGTRRTLATTLAACVQVDALCDEGLDARLLLLRSGHPASIPNRECSDVAQECSTIQFQMELLRMMLSNELVPEHWHDLPFMTGTTQGGARSNIKHVVEQIAPVHWKQPVHVSQVTTGKVASGNGRLGPAFRYQFLRWAKSCSSAMAEDVLEQHPDHVPDTVRTMIEASPSLSLPIIPSLIQAGHNIELFNLFGAWLSRKEEINDMPHTQRGVLNDLLVQ